VLELLSAHFLRSKAVDDSLLHKLRSESCERIRAYTSILLLEFGEALYFVSSSGKILIRLELQTSPSLRNQVITEDCFHRYK
jgi:hypothetical protein